METSVADDFCGGEGFLNFVSCKILSVASEKQKNLSYCPRKTSNTSRAYTVGVVSNYSMTVPCSICRSIIEQNDEISNSRIVE